MTLELIDLEDLGENALHDFTRTVAGVESGQSEHRADAAKHLVAKVEFTYALAAKLAHREQTVEGTAAIWAKTVAICDQIAVALGKTIELNQAALDRVLDFRNAAERRRELHS